MSKNPKISVIVPVYKCEKDLSKCLDSLILQMYDNLEIICVNDGSPDNSQQILDEYALKDKRIKLLAQENRGQSSARNFGLANATGDYVSFIDSDDWVSLCLYKKFVDIINELEETIDIYTFNGAHYYEKPDMRITDVRTFFDINKWRRRSEKNIFKFADCTSPFSGNMSICNKIYRRNFLLDNKCKFEENIIFEDQLFYYTTFICADNIYLNSDIQYYYRQSEHSTMHSLKDNVMDIFTVINSIRNLLIEHDLYDRNKYALLQHKFKQYSYLLFVAAENIREEFYNKGKEDLAQEITNDFNMEIVNKLIDVNLYHDMSAMSYQDFYNKYKKFVII